MLAAVRQWGYALEYASAELRNDREMVLAAVRQTGYALEYANMPQKIGKMMNISCWQRFKALTPLANMVGHYYMLQTEFEIMNP